MISLYGNRWTSQFGFVTTDKGELSEFAKEWQIGLSGLSLDQIKRGFDVLTAGVMNTKGECWPPSCWPDFRKLCVSSDSIPSLDEIVSILAFSNSIKGSLATRYKHPLAFAISQSKAVDMRAIRTAKTVDAKRMVKPVYEQFLAAGWNDWPENAFKDEKKALPFIPNKDLGRAAFGALRAVL